MKVKLTKLREEAIMPVRAHHNDAGADVFSCKYMILPPYAITKVPLGISIELPDGYVAYVLPRSGMSSNKGITTEVVPIDSSYTGEIHAIVHNTASEPYIVNHGDKIAQLVIMPVVVATFIEEVNKRGDKGFGSTGY